MKQICIILRKRDFISSCRNCLRWPSRKGLMVRGVKEHKHLRCSGDDTILGEPCLSWYDFLLHCPLTNESIYDIYTSLPFPPNHVENKSPYNANRVGLFQSFMYFFLRTIGFRNIISTISLKNVFDFTTGYSYQQFLSLCSAESH